MVLDNADLVLHGHACVLVPYRPEHVPVYHEWMGARSAAPSRAAAGRTPAFAPAAAAAKRASVASP